MTLFGKPAFRTLVGAGLLFAGQTALACGEKCGVIGDYLWEDCNGNGIQDDAGIADCDYGGGIPGQHVELRTPNPKDPSACRARTGPNGEPEVGDLLETKSTGPGGVYSFTGLAAGDYCVQFPGRVLTCPDGSIGVYGAYTTKNAPGSTNENDSDAFGSGRTQVIHLGDEQSELTIDAGAYCLVSIGDTLWNDLDRDGIQDDLNGSGPDSEPGINGVTVTLFECDDTSVGSSTTTADQDGDPNRPGWYQFDGLVPGCYLVQFATPDGFVFSPANQGGDPELDSNVNPSGATGEVNLVSGESNQTIDAGVNRPPTAGLGDFVFEDLNADGIQESNEPGIPDVPVTLLTPGDDGNCNTQDDQSTDLSTTTDGMGLYAFEGLDPGDYCVEFDKTNVPCEFGDATFSPQGQGDPAQDSDPDPATGVTGNVNLAADEFDPTIDAGIYCPAALGDRVWNDLNGDGLQDCSDTNGNGIIGDAGDTGPECNQAAVADVQVNLLNRVGDECGTEILYSATTDNQGFYAFDGLTPGVDYCVQWVRPADTECTTPNVGDDPAIDSDGIQTNATCQTNEPIVLASNEFDRNWDLGLVETPPECDLLLDKKCRVETPPSPVFTDKCDGKIQQFTVTWTGDNAVTVSGIPNDDDDGVIEPNQAVTFFTPGDGDNDVFIDVVDTASGTFLGESKFHRSCSDKDMDADTESNDAQLQVSDAGQDCGKFQGNAKDNDEPEFVNVWTLAGLVDAEGKVLSCSPPEPGPFTDSCEFEQSLVSCETYGKPDSFTFRYLGDGSVSDCTDNAASRAGDKEPVCSGNLPEGATVMISVNNGDLSKDEVAPGETFRLSGFGSSTEMTLVGSGATEVDAFHTSCSAPLEVGDVFGNLLLVAFDDQRSSATVTYLYEVTNLGDPVTDIAVTDDPLGDIGVIEVLPTEDGSDSAILQAVAEISETTTNTATAIGTLSNVNACAAPQDSVTVTAVAPTCDVSIRLDKVEDDKIKWRLDNLSDVDATIETLEVSWPGSGKLDKVKFDGSDILKDVLLMSPASIDSDEWQKEPKDLTLKAGDDNKELKLEFDARFPLEKDQPAADFELEVIFEQGCSVTF